MLAVLPFSVLLICPVFGGGSSLYSVDDPLVKTVKNIIATVEDYIEDHQLRELQLPDIGILPLDPIKLREGKIGQFDTIRLAGTPQISQQLNKDGSSTYTFNVNLDLNLLMVQYQFHLNLPKPFAQDGQVILMPQKHVMEVKGIVVVGPGKKCDAHLYSAHITQFESFQVDIEPSDIPFVSSISEKILNFISPKLLAVTNVVLKTATLLPDFQNNFKEIICRNITNSS